MSAINHVPLVLNVLNSEAFACVYEDFLEVWSNCIEVYTNRFLKGADSAEIASGMAAYFSAIDMGIGIRVQELLLSTLAELQAIALVLECIPSFCSVVLYSDSQSTIDKKNILVRWIKIKEHLGVLSNVRADKLAGKATFFPFSLPVGIQERFLVAEDTAVSGNTYYFVHDLFQSICHAYWKAGPGYDIVLSAIIREISWAATLKHLDSHILSSFTSKSSANMHTYLIKAVHRQLSVAVKKRLYNVNYPGVLCLLYGEVEVFDHTFVCSGNVRLCDDILANVTKK
ncbi:hypothetical protein G9A89_008537 [Geosiphon pyriformis]|nr:hypothetical protein G9A89_008537 [Geosiphon pyriformis]